MSHASSTQVGRVWVCQLLARPLCILLFECEEFLKLLASGTPFLDAKPLFGIETGWTVKCWLDIRRHDDRCGAR
jgi:hypothetical protein